MQRRIRVVALLFAAAVVLLISNRAWGAIQVSLSSNLSSPQPVGSPITWAAAASDVNAGTLTYRFSVALVGGPYSIVRDYSYGKTFAWIQSSAEGNYQIRVTVKNNTSLETVSTSKAFQITARASSSLPVVVTPTANPLVALYSTSVCPIGYAVSIAFQALGDSSVQYTPVQTCTKKTLNLYIAGMRASTRYVITPGIFSGGVFWPIASAVTFTTGAVASIAFPTIANLSTPPAGSELRPVLLHSYIGASFTDTATDLAGNIIWYYVSSIGGYVTHPEPGGKMFVMSFGANDPYQQPLREIDLAGNTVLETSAGAVNEQLLALGAQPITSFHHEARRLANGNILVLGSVERMNPSVQYGVDVIGDEIIILSPNLRVLWTWNAFDHLDVNRAAILGETCTNLAPGCPPFHLASIANDWLHSNAADVGSDGNIIISLRHQDWIAKIDYRNGAGTGAVLWRLGSGGDFAIVSSDAHPWFSHAHDAHWEFGTVAYLSLFDNGNTRHASDATAHSRGQLLTIDETNRVVTPTLNFDLGVYSPALGSAQMLSDGNVTAAHYEAGDINGTQVSQSLSIYSLGVVDMQSQANTYRSFAMRTLYQP